MLDAEDLLRPPHLVAADLGEVAQDVRVVGQLGVEHVAALAPGARDDEDVVALVDVLRHDRGALARLVVGVRVHAHEAEAFCHGRVLQDRGAAQATMDSLHLRTPHRRLRRTPSTAPGPSMPLPRPAPGTTRWWVVGAVGITAEVAVIVWFGLASANALSADVTSYEWCRTPRCTLGYDVHRPDGAAVRCTIEAQDVRHGRVGTVTDDVPAGARSVHREVTVRTSARAVTGVVASCVRVP